MGAPLRLRNLAQFRTVVGSGGGIAITDVAGAPVFHPHPDECPHVRESHFETKVIANAERNGSYFAVPSLADAQAEWPGAVRCRSAACSDAPGAGASAEPLPIRAVLAAATGSDAVRDRRQPPVGVETPMPDWASTQRIALGRRDDALVLSTWPAELKAQARTVYGTEVGAAVVELVEGTDGWLAEPIPHLAFNGAAGADRFYFRCPLSLPDYVARWSRPEDLAEVRGHPADSVRSRLWPWLCERGYADPDAAENATGLDRYMEALERRRSQAHIRPSVALWKPCAGQDETSLRAEVSGAVGELAAALREPPVEAARS